jgi:hypothetical protein
MNDVRFALQDEKPHEITLAAVVAIGGGMAVSIVGLKTRCKSAETQRWNGALRYRTTIAR